MPAEHGLGTILVVDDSSVVLRMSVAILNRHGFDAITATSGHEAIAVLQSAAGPKVDLVLLDVVMKGMTGPEVAGEIRHLNPRLPIVFMTGFPEHRKVLEAGEAPFIQKPFTSITLIRKIREALDRRKTASAGE